MCWSVFVKKKSDPRSTVHQFRFGQSLGGLPIAGLVGAKSGETAQESMTKGCFGDLGCPLVFRAYIRCPPPIATIARPAMMQARLP